MDRAHAPAQALLIAACAWLPACGLNQEGVSPPADTIAFPASAVLDRDGDWLFVTNSNADLRYNDGTLMAFSLTRARIDRTPNDPDPNIPKLHPDWGNCDFVDQANPRSDKMHTCCWDAVDNNILNCDERHYVGSDTEASTDDDPTMQQSRGRGNVRIGSFAAGMVLEKATCPRLKPVDNPTGDPNLPPLEACDVCAPVDYSTTDDRLLLGVRGDTSLTFIDVMSVGPDTPPTLKCVGDPATPGDFETCDDLHRIINTPTALASPMEDPQDTQPVPLPDEPYALAIDDTSGVLYIGHLTGNTSRPFTGGFSLFDIAPLGDVTVLPPPRFIAPFPSPFPANALGSQGVTAIKVQTEPMFGLTRSVSASSRFVPQVSGLGTTATCPDNPIREIAAFPNGVAYSSPLGGAETRGIEFVGDRAFVLQRSPPTLIGFIASNMAPTDLLETCGSPTFLDQYDSGVGPRLFVTCFADGEIYVFDPALPQLVKTFSVGRGPAGLVFDGKRQVAYVVGFGDNNISVVDLTPGSRTEYHVIQRIGFPRTSPR